jgi:hypothetical protein
VAVRGVSRPPPNRLTLAIVTVTDLLFASFVPTVGAFVVELLLFAAYAVLGTLGSAVGSWATGLIEWHVHGWTSCSR